MKKLRIKDICDKGSSNLKQKDVEGAKGLYPVYGASGIISYINTFHQEDNYIAIVKDGSGIGRVKFMPAKSSVIGTMQYILPKKGFNINYIGYCLQSLDLSRYKQGAAIPHIYFRDYGERFVKVTENITEQQRIVEYLDAAFAKIDRMKANALKALDEAKVLFQSALTEAMTPKAEWQVIRLDSICDIQSGYAFKSSVFLSEGKYQIIRMGNVRPGQLRLDEKPVFFNQENSNILNKSLLKVGDIIITQTGTRHKRDYGYTTIIENNNLLLNQRLSRIRVSDKILNKYLLYYTWCNIFRNQFFANEGGTVGQGNVGMDAIKGNFISLPPLSEQQEVVMRLDSFFSRVKVLQANCTRIAAECNALKQSILKQLFE